MTGKSEDDSLNLYAYKQQLLAGYKPVPGKRGSIGIPLCLNMYELLPFWYTFWTRLGFAVHTSPVRYRLLPGQAEPWPHQGPEPDASGCHLLPLPDLQL